MFKSSLGRLVSRGSYSVILWFPVTTSNLFSSDSDYEQWFKVHLWIQSAVLQKNRTPFAPDVFLECDSLTIASWASGQLLFTQSSPHQRSNISTWRQKCLGGCVKNLNKVGDIPRFSPHPQILFFDKYLAASLVNHGKFSKSVVNLCCLFPVIIFPFPTTQDFRKDVLHDFPGGWSKSEQLVISLIVFSLFENSCYIWGLSWLSRPSPSLQNLSNLIVNSPTITSAGSLSTFEWHPHIPLGHVWVQIAQGTPSPCFLW